MSYLKSIGIDVGVIAKGLNYKVSLANTRIDNLEAGVITDATDVDYTPVSVANWSQCGCSSIGNVSNALDQLAKLRAFDTNDIDAIDSRVGLLEAGGGGGGLASWSEDGNASLLPDNNDTQDIGSATQKVRDLYLGPSSLKIVDDQNQVQTYDKTWFENRIDATSLNNYATQVSLGNYAKISDLSSYAQSSDLNDYATKVSLGNVDTRLQSQETLSAYTIATLPNNAKKGTTVLVEDGNETGSGVALAYWFNGVWYRSSDNAVLADRTIDVYLLAGQSNAHGHATVADLDSSRHNQNGLFYTSWHQGTSNASSEQYYSDWLTSIVAGNTRGDDNNSTLGNSLYFGPEIGFASKAEEIGLTNRGFAVLKHAIGASTLIDDSSDPTGGLSDWDLTGTGDRRGDAYRAFKRALTDGLGKLEALGYGYNLKGMIWWQGESNITGATYQDLIDFIADFRNYLDTTYTLSTPKEEFPIVITGTTNIWGTDFEDEVANKDSYIGFVNAEDFGQRSGNGIHVGSSADSADRDSDGINDMFEIGEQYAIQMQKAQAGLTAGWVPDVSNVNLWVNADDDSTITVDSGTGYVTQVDSVTGTNYFVPTSGSTIEHVLDTTLDRKVLRFTGSSPTTSFVGSSLEDHSSWSPYTGTQDWFIVVKPIIDNGQDIIMGTMTGRDIRLVPSTSNRYNWFWNTPSQTNQYIGNLISPTDINNTAVLITTRFDFTNKQISAWCNGTQTYSNVAVPTNLTYDLSTNVKFCLMQQINNRWRVDGDLYEVITSMQLSDREKIEGYLAHKWGMDGLLPTSHAYHSAPP